MPQPTFDSHPHPAVARVLSTLLAQDCNHRVISCVIASAVQ